MNAGLLKLILTAFIVTVMPSIILSIKLYFPLGAVNDCQPPVPLSLRPNSHVSIVIFTSSKLCSIQCWKKVHVKSKKKSVSKSLWWIDEILNSIKTLTNVIGTLFNLVQLIRNDTWLHQADVNRIHDGSSSKSVNTSSFNCKLDRSPSPRNALTFILSGDKSLT